MSEQVNKQNIIEENRSHDKDTGSSEVQIALLTARIAHLTEHLKKHGVDNILSHKIKGKAAAETFVSAVHREKSWHNGKVF